MSFGRDIMFDPFKLLSENETPAKGDEIAKDFISKIATAKCYKHEQEAKGSSLPDKLTLFLGATMVLLALAIGLKAAF
jgi:hypothetical protein